MKRIGNFLWNILTSWKAWVATLVFAGLVWFFSWFMKSENDISVKIRSHRNTRKFVDA